MANSYGILINDFIAAYKDNSEDFKTEKNNEIQRIKDFINNEGPVIEKLKLDINEPTPQNIVRGFLDKNNKGYWSNKGFSEEEKKKLDELWDVRNNYLHSTNKAAINKSFKLLKDKLSEEYVKYKVDGAAFTDRNALKNHIFISIKSNETYDIKNDTKYADITNKKGFYVTVNFNYKENIFSIVLCFGSEEGCIEYSQTFYKEALDDKRKEIDNKTTDDKKINTNGLKNYVLCCYDYSFDEIKSITDDTFKEKLNNILDLYETGIKWINEKNWLKNFKSYIPLEKRLNDSFKKHKEVKEDYADIFLRSRQTILYGPPGTGKTRLAKAVACALLDVESEDKLENTEQFMFVQFHPGYSYSEFVETISMESKYAEKNNIKYGKFRNIVERAKDDSNNPYVLIIDEINRANVSETFGELLYGLEYRGGVPIKTSISQTELVVPENLFIICTMNTADRSLQSLDYALRRRFVFVPVYSKAPELNNTNKIFANKLYETVCGWIKESVARGVDPQDIMPGISYFLINKNNIDGKHYDEKHLEYKLNYELIPLLEEYMKNGMFSNRFKIVDGKSLTELLKEHKLQEELEKVNRADRR